jgi:arylsulfatase A-like enzyme
MWPGLKRWKFPDLPILQNTEVVDVVEDMDEQAGLCRLFTEEAVKFIRTNKDNPFFVYLPHAFVHLPRQASPQFMEDGKTVETSQVEEVDWSVGQVLDTLRDEKLADDTLVIFTSDNGPAGGLSAGPLRGRKGSAFEGGHREPTIAWWPGTIPSGTACDELCTAMDLHPTFAKMVGESMPSDRVIDGKDIAPLLLGEEGAKTPYDRFFYQQAGKLAAVRSGNWKLFTNGQLYNLAEDIGEKSNVAEQNPDKAAMLQSMLEAFRKDISENSRPVGTAPDSRTLVPRPGVKGDEGFIPTLQLGKSG